MRFRLLALVLLVDVLPGCSDTQGGGGDTSEPGSLGLGEPCKPTDVEAEQPCKTASTCIPIEECSG